MQGTDTQDPEKHGINPKPAVELFNESILLMQIWNFSQKSAVANLHGAKRT